MQDEAVKAVVEKWKYQDDDCILVPYTSNTKNFAFPEDFLVQLYYRAKTENVLDLIFPGMVVDLNFVIGSLRTKPIIVGLTKPDYNVSGVGWLYEIEGVEGARKASIGFLFFRNGTHGKEARKQKLAVRAIAHLALKWWFEELKCNVLFGTMLETNKVARNFSERVGFRQVATIPNFLHRGSEFRNAILLMQTKEEFLLKEASDGFRSKQRR